MEEAKSLLEIIKYFLWEKEYVPNHDIDEKKLYDLAKANHVSPFLQNWAQKQVRSQEIKNQIYQDYTIQIIRDTNQNIELDRILNEFENNHIKTLVVKGAIIKDIYPQNYIREMHDIDILVDSNDWKKAIKLMKNMNFSKDTDGEKHLVFTKRPFILVEMHKKLAVKEDTGYAYLNDVWPLCVKYKNYHHIYQLDKENAYIFCMIHLLQHFKFTGIKIKDVLDVYLYNETYKDTLNYDLLNKILQDLEIKEFEQNIRNISYKWFGSDKVDEFNAMEYFILQGSSIHNRVNYSIGENDGKMKFFIKLLFPNMEIMKEKFPVLERFPLLLPVMWITRIVKKGIFSKQFLLNFHTVKLINSADTKDVQKVKDIYHDLGIK